MTKTTADLLLHKLYHFFLDWMTTSMFLWNQKHHSLVVSFDLVPFKFQNCSNVSCPGLGLDWVSVLKALVLCWSRHTRASFGVVFAHFCEQRSGPICLTYNQLWLFAAGHEVKSPIRGFSTQMSVLMRNKALDDKQKLSAAQKQAKNSNTGLIFLQQFMHATFVLNYEDYKV